MQSPNCLKRVGDECYTPIDVVEKLQKQYNLYGRNIWLPFCVESSPFYQVLSKDNNVILSPEHTKTYIGEQLSLVVEKIGYKGEKTNASYYYDFDKAIRDKKFIDKIRQEKYVVFDNPPFIGLAKRLFKLDILNIPFYLFCNALTITSIYYTLRNYHNKFGFDFLGTVSMENSGYKRTVSIAIITNTTFKIKSLFLQHKKSSRTLKSSINPYLLNPGQMIQLLRRGYEFDITDYEVIKYKPECFGGYFFKAVAGGKMYV